MTVCMLCSVGYHLFSCHRSEKTCRRWMALDYAGISIGILGCYVSGVFYAFYCNNYWRQVYLITVLAMILAVFFAQIHPNYLTQQWQRLRSIIFCSVSGYGVIPTLHWVWLNGGIGAPIVQDFAPRVVVMYVIALLAFLFYISKVPESSDVILVASVDGELIPRVRQKSSTVWKETEQHRRGPIRRAGAVGADGR
ncbi:PAQR3 [Cervus elaphus hippelaphus]|uniref:PAQR3 n=1 Tax=Cervus elaphus hippelaphus TaxID=46360 RepID=A0A212D5R1_CEREH|nr:PAQR3 [Cervus elaphus hippelaphus]